MRIHKVAALMGLAAASLAAMPAEAANRAGRCEPAVESELNRLNVDPGRVGDISLQIRSYNNREDNTRVSGVLGWVELRDCRGRLVVDMTPRCRVKQSYTTGACTVSGLRQF